MDSDSCRREQNQKEDTQEKSDGPKQEGISGNRKSDGKYVFPSMWIRRAFFDYNEVNKFLLDYGLCVLLPISIIAYPVFFLFS